MYMHSFNNYANINYDKIIRGIHDIIIIFTRKQIAINTIYACLGCSLQFHNNLLENKFQFSKLSMQVGH